MISADSAGADVADIAEVAEMKKEGVMMPSFFVRIQICR